MNFFFLCAMLTSCLLFFTISEPQSRKAVLMDNNNSSKNTLNPYPFILND